MTPKKLPNELLYEMVSSIKFHKKWSQIRVCAAFDHFLLGRMGHWLEKMKIVSEQCLSEVQTLCQLLLGLPGIFRPKGISMVRSKTDGHMAGLLTLFEGSNIPVLNWHYPPTLNFPRDIRARVGLPLAKDAPNYVNEMHAKFVQIVAIACQWPEATLTDLNILKYILEGKCSNVRFVTQRMIEKKADFYPCTSFC